MGLTGRVRNRLDRPEFVNDGDLFFLSDSATLSVVLTSGCQEPILALITTDAGQ